MERNLWRLMGLSLVFVFLFLGSSYVIPHHATAADTIKIGHIDPFSGPFSEIGEVYYTALKFAVDEQNKKGGLLGKQIEILKEDNELKPDVTTRKAKKLILENKVNFIGVGTGSHIGIAMNKVADTYKTIFIAFGPGAQEITGKEFTRYTFRVSQDAHMLVEGLVQLLAATPYRKVYMINMDFAWGHQAAEKFKVEVKKYIPDAIIVGEDFVPIANKDYAPYITKAQNAKPDIIYSGNYGPDALLMVKQARAMGMRVPFPFLMNFGLSPTIQNELKEESVGIYASDNYSMRVDTPENREMIKRYREYRKDDTNIVTKCPFALIGHSIIAWQMVFAGIEKAKSVDSEKFISAFEGFRYKSPVGLWEMRKCDHQLICPLYGGSVKAGPNPFYDFPWMQPNIVTIPAEKAVIPATPDYNARCR